MLRMVKLVLAAAMFMIATVPAQAQDPFSDARKSLLAGELEGALLAISTGAISVDSQDEQGFTLLHYAAQSGSQDAVRALLDRGADPTIQAKDGSTAAALAKLPAIRDELLAAAASRTAAGTSGASSAGQPCQDAIVKH